MSRRMFPLSLEDTLRHVLRQGLEYEPSGAAIQAIVFEVLYGTPLRLECPLTVPTTLPTVTPEPSVEHLMPSHTSNRSPIRPRPSLAREREVNNESLSYEHSISRHTDIPLDEQTHVPGDVAAPLEDDDNKRQSTSTRDNMKDTTSKTDDHERGNSTRGRGRGYGRDRRYGRGRGRGGSRGRGRAGKRPDTVYSSPTDTIVLESPNQISEQNISSSVNRADNLSPLFNMIEDFVERMSNDVSRPPSPTTVDTATVNQNISRQNENSDRTSSHDTGIPRSRENTSSPVNTVFSETTRSKGKLNKYRSNLTPEAETAHHDSRHVATRGLMSSNNGPNTTKVGHSKRKQRSPPRASDIATEHEHYPAQQPSISTLTSLENEPDRTRADRRKRKRYSPPSAVTTTPSVTTSRAEIGRPDSRCLSVSSLTVSKTVPDTTRVDHPERERNSLSKAVKLDSIKGNTQTRIKTGITPSEDHGYRDLDQLVKASEMIGYI
ncbi:hypothetical protein PV08_12098 [Exophiala spinifera]|uniref:Uncharacterized protein n=1 Tax=Exophiala spinifera TaxID=91928 RepID=A0A0D2BE33_9EURO|nr:uncharacterized protein PV08_12098 [Exophiala spinifera]KIW09649.1 hypothetical protein PV08_12098 [Exophiala spinifera]